MVARLCASIVAIALLVLGPLVAHADDPNLAKREFQLGFKDLNAGRFEKALAHYERSYEAESRSRTLFNMALCEEELGRYKDAIDHYQQFLVEGEQRDADFFDQARSKLAELQLKIGGRIEIVSTPSGASVSVNGTRKGRTPIRLDLVAGQHMVEVSRKGSRSSERRINVEVGMVATESFSLDPVGHVTIEVAQPDAVIRRRDVDDVKIGTYDEDLSPGHYVFEITLMGYKPRTVKVALAAGKIFDRHIGLEHQSSTGALAIHSDTSGLNVTIDGLVVGSTRIRDDRGARLERRLPAGNHTVLVEDRDGKSWSQRVHLSPGEALDVDLRFSSRSKSRRYIGLGLTTIGATAVLTGLTMGALAIVDVRSADASVHPRGHTRATTADALVAVGAASLLGAWFAHRAPPMAELKRSYEGESP